MGYDLRGIMYWTLVDNFEWGFGYSMRVRWQAAGGLPWCWMARPDSVCREQVGGKRKLRMASAFVVDSLLGSACITAPCIPSLQLPPLPPATQFGVYGWENDGSQKRVARKSAALLKSWCARGERLHVVCQRRLQH